MSKNLSQEIKNGQNYQIRGQNSTVLHLKNRDTVKKNRDGMKFSKKNRGLSLLTRDGFGDG